MSTIPMLTEHNIRTFVGEQNFLKDQHYVRDGAIVDLAQQGMMLKAYSLVHSLNHTVYRVPS